MQKNIFNLNNLRILQAVAETKSLSLAAERLELSQSAISRSISRLEEQIGANLFLRRSSPIQLTLLGQHIYSKAESVLSQYAKLNQSIRNFHDIGVYDLRIGASTSLARTVLPEIVCNLYSRGLSVTEYSNNTPVISELLQDGTIDIAIATDPIKSNPSVKSRALFTEKYLVLLSNTVAPRIQTRLDLQNSPAYKQVLSHMICFKPLASFETFQLVMSYVLTVFGQTFISLASARHGDWRHRSM